jgi:hypothetical protein
MSFRLNGFNGLGCKVSHKVKRLTGLDALVKQVPEVSQESKLTRYNDWPKLAATMILNDLHAALLG